MSMERVRERPHPPTGRPLSEFLILGCQRSGTTLLRLVLDSHPDIDCYDEPVAYDLLTGGAKPAMSGFKIPRWTVLLPGPTWGDPDQSLKSPWTYRGETLIGIYRQPEDVIYSMASLNMGRLSWLERYGEPILVARLGVDTVCDLKGRGGLWAVGAEYWRRKNQALLDLHTAGYPMILISYESLVGRPEENLRTVLDFVGAKWDNAVLNHPRATRYTDGGAEGVAAGGTDPRRPIDTFSVGRGADLPRAARATIRDIAGDLPDKLSYLSAPAQ